MRFRTLSRNAAAVAAFAILIAAAPAGAQVSTTDTRLLAQPAASANRIAFAYAGDLWTARLNGDDVRHLTTAEGDESNPIFSPDGSLIAFAANYDGNTDVYVVSAMGGEPRRLTWHPGNDTPRAFTPDGQRILFTSNRADYSGRYTQLFTVPANGGIEERIPIPNAADAVYSGRRRLHVVQALLLPAVAQGRDHRRRTLQRRRLARGLLHRHSRPPRPQ